MYNWVILLYGSLAQLCKTTILQLIFFLIFKKRNQKKKKKSNQEQRPLATPHQVTAFPAQSTIWGVHYPSRNCFGFRSAALSCQFAKEPWKLIFNRTTRHYDGPSGGFLLIYTYLNTEKPNLFERNHLSTVCWGQLRCAIESAQHRWLSVLWLCQAAAAGLLDTLQRKAARLWRCLSTVALLS